MVHDVFLKFVQALLVCVLELVLLLGLLSDDASVIEKLQRFQFLTDTFLLVLLDLVAQLLEFRQGLEGDYGHFHLDD